MAVLESATRRGPEFERNAAAYAELITVLRERHGTVVEGGGERLRRRHIERKKIPVRDRIDHLVDPLTPFLELSPLAAWGLHANEVPAAGIVTGIGVISGVRCMIVAND